MKPSEFAKKYLVLTDGLGNLYSFSDNQLKLIDEFAEGKLKFYKGRKNTRIVNSNNKTP